MKPPHACYYLENQRRPLRGCNAPTLSAALPQLTKSGVGLVDGVVDPQLVSEVKATSAYQSMPTRVVRARERPPTAWRQSAFGRFHQREEAFEDKGDLKVIERVERAFWPLVVAFFEEDDDGAQGFVRSECQIMTAVPRCASQKWHSDNRSRGLTIIVPLSEFTVGNGATQLLVGSHNKSWPLVAQQGAQVVEAPTGSIVAFDSRTYHRGLGNGKKEARPALIFCYDRPDSPPPGCDFLESRAHACLAAVLNIASAAWISVSS